MRQAQRHYSLDEYFGIEEISEIRHEYLDGEIFAMSGGTPERNQIALNLHDLLRPLRGKGCRSYVADVRVITPAGLYTYPDFFSGLRRTAPYQRSPAEFHESHRHR